MYLECHQNFSITYNNLGNYKSKNQIYFHILSHKIETTATNYEVCSVVVEVLNLFYLEIVSFAYAFSK